MGMHYNKVTQVTSTIAGANDNGNKSVDLRADAN